MSLPIQPPRAARRVRSSCLHRRGLAGRHRTTSPVARGSATVTWGSDLTGDPVPIRGTWREDSEFWNKGVRAPRSGLITKFRLKVGSQPKTIPIRFSVVRPVRGGKVKVITTTHPPYTLKAKKPGIKTFRTSVLAFKCCKIRKGDYVAVDNSGANTVQDPFHWFAMKPGKTTYSHMVRGVSQDFGQLWTHKSHPDHEVLLQIVQTTG